MDFVVVIPARFGSTRLPGKPLMDIAGKPMVQWVYEQALLSAATEVIIATDDSRVADAAKAFGATVCMTAETHESGTDRLQEVAQCMGWADDKIVVNVQGDEPLLPPAVINQVAHLLAADDEAAVATLSERIVNSDDLFSPAVVKVVSGIGNRALYFSRAPIPWQRDSFSIAEPSIEFSSGHWQRHIGIYAYRVAALNNFVGWPLGQLEAIEKLEQLRVLENGGIICVEESVETIPGGVDTLADLQRVRDYIASRGMMA